MAVVRTPKVSLRLMAEADLPIVLAWRNHPKIRLHMYSQGEISLTEHAEWFRDASAKPSRVLLIFVVNDTPAGYANFTLYDGKQAKWGFYLAPNAPKGAGYFLGEAVTDHGFSVLGLEKIWGEVLEKNTPSQHFHIRHGFEYETTFLLGLSNVHKYVLTKNAWQAHKGKCK